MSTTTKNHIKENRINTIERKQGRGSEYENTNKKGKYKGALEDHK